MTYLDQVPLSSDWRDTSVTFASVKVNICGFVKKAVILVLNGVLFGKMGRNMIYPAGFIIAIICFITTVNCAGW